jgi:SAM-dependent methyltransferase
MSFTEEWLALREPADVAARDPRLLERAAQAARGAAQGAAPVIVDLGCGTGATARALGPYLPPDTRWRLVDNDARLLARAMAETGAGAEAHRLDLAALDALPLAGAHLVTASALLDLVSRDWLAGLAARLARAGIGVYAALSYDGRMAWEPPLAADTEITAAFNAHQRRDKGFGPALGPDAVPVAERLFAAKGFGVETAPSPWHLGPEQAQLHGELLDGIARAAAEAGLSGARAWGQARRAACRYTACVVGHSDLLALPRTPATLQSNRMSEPSA